MTQILVVQKILKFKAKTVSKASFSQDTYEEKLFETWKA